MVRRPDDMNAFEFAVLAGLRAAQLNRGCTPRVERSPKVAVTAQHEVAARKVLPLDRAAVLDSTTVVAGKPMADLAIPEEQLEPTFN